MSQISGTNIKPNPILIHANGAINLIQPGGNTIEAKKRDSDGGTGMVLGQQIPAYNYNPEHQKMTANSHDLVSTILKFSKEATSGGSGNNTGRTANINGGIMKISTQPTKVH